MSFCVSWSSHQLKKGKNKGEDVIFVQARSPNPFKVKVEVPPVEGMASQRRRVARRAATNQTSEDNSQMNNLCFYKR